MTTTLDALAERVARDAALGPDEASIIAGSHDLIAVGMMADGVRRRLHGNRTTFLRVFAVHVDAVPPAVPSGASAGEFRLTGEPASLDAACAAVAAARRLAGDAVLTAFSLPFLAGLGADAFARLARAGLDGIAETPADSGSAAARAIEAARTAGLRVERLTVDAPPPDPVSLVIGARDLQRAAGGFRVFAPLPRTLSTAAPTTGYDDVKLLALARLVVREIPSIQVDWPLYGPKLAQVALTVGADDVDGVAAVESGLLGARRSALEEIRGNIRAAGLEPVERDGRYLLSVS